MGHDTVNEICVFHFPAAQDLAIKPYHQQHKKTMTHFHYIVFRKDTSVFWSLLYNFISKLQLVLQIQNIALKTVPCHCYDPKQCQTINEAEGQVRDRLTETVAKRSGFMFTGIVRSTKRRKKSIPRLWVILHIIF